ncbi:MAG: hypothetical protein E3J36_02480 [Candidatus Nealsonbacteria bacterium]|nr:MAG: hypothetical protein E3J36_02480 [Candidatus Nealsonbacteria bacterium]
MEETPKKGQKNILAIISYIGILCLVPILMKEKDEFVKFHAKQGLVLFIAEVATLLISWIPILGWFIGFILWIIWVVLSLIGIINAVDGKQVPLPVIGKFAKKFKF